MVTEAAGAQAAAAAPARVTSSPSSAAPVTTADTAAQPVSSAAAALPAAVRSVVEDKTQHSLQPTVSSIHTMLQALAASLAAHGPVASAHQPAINATHQLRGVGSRMQDAACGTETTACQDAASGAAGNEAASQTRTAASGRATAMQPVASPGHACGGGSCLGPDDTLAAAVQRASKWKARCKELRRALAASREAAALCSSLQVGPTRRSVS